MAYYCQKSRLFVKHSSSVSRTTFSTFNLLHQQCSRKNTLERNCSSNILNVTLKKTPIPRAFLVAICYPFDRGEGDNWQKVLQSFTRLHLTSTPPKEISKMSTSYVLTPQSPRFLKMQTFQIHSEEWTCGSENNSEQLMKKRGSQEDA